MGKYDRVVDVILGEAKSGNKADMLAIASVMANRANATNSDLETVARDPSAFNAQSPARGSEKYREMAEAALEQVLTDGPVHNGTFYATPNQIQYNEDGTVTFNADGTKIEGLEREYATSGHAFFVDPQNRPIVVAGQTKPVVMANIPVPTPNPRSATTPTATAFTSMDEELDYPGFGLPPMEDGTKTTGQFAVPSRAPSRAAQLEQAVDKVPIAVTSNGFSAVSIPDFMREELGVGRIVPEGRAFMDNGRTRTDPALMSAVAAAVPGFEATNPGYDVDLHGPGSLTRTGTHTGNHGHVAGTGKALDVAITNAQGQELTNYVTPSAGQVGTWQETAPTYQDYANRVAINYAAENPESVPGDMRWGGYFGGGYGARDLQHLDTTGGPQGRYGNILGGFNKDKSNPYQGGGVLQALREQYGVPQFTGNPLQDARDFGLAMRMPDAWTPNRENMAFVDKAKTAGTMGPALWGEEGKLSMDSAIQPGLLSGDFLSRDRLASPAQALPSDDPKADPYESSTGMRQVEAIPASGRPDRRESGIAALPNGVLSRQAPLSNPASLGGLNYSVASATPDAYNPRSGGAAQAAPGFREPQATTTLPERPSLAGAGRGFINPPNVAPSRSPEPGFLSTQDADRYSRMPDPRASAYQSMPPSQGRVTTAQLAAANPRSNPSQPWSGPAPYTPATPARSVAPAQSVRSNPSSPSVQPTAYTAPTQQSANPRSNLSSPSVGPAAYSKPSIPTSTLASQYAAYGAGQQQPARAPQTLPGSIPTPSRNPSYTVPTPNPRTNIPVPVANPRTNIPTPTARPNYTATITQNSALPGLIPTPTRAPTQLTPSRAAAFGMVETAPGKYMPNVAANPAQVMRDQAGLIAANPIASIAKMAAGAMLGGVFGPGFGNMFQAAANTGNRTGMNVGAGFSSPAGAGGGIGALGGGGGGGGGGFGGNGYGGSSRGSDGGFNSGYTSSSGFTYDR